MTELELLVWIQLDEDEVVMTAEEDEDVVTFVFLFSITKGIAKAEPAKAATIMLYEKCMLNVVAVDQCSTKSSQ